MNSCSGNQAPGGTSSPQDPTRYFKDLFLHSPIPTWVEDFSGIKALFDRAREAGARDFQTFLESHPGEIERCADLVRIVEVNQASLDFFQARSIADIPANLSSFFREDSWPVFREEMIALASGARRFESKIPIYDLGGNRRIVNLTLTVVPEATTDLTCVMITFIDITERERLDAALRESEERFRILLRDIPSISVQGYDANGNVTYWNKASSTLYGYSGEEAIGRNLTELIIPPAMRPAVRDAIQHMVATLQPIPSGPLDLMRKDGSTVTVFSSHVVMQIPGRGFELYCLDIDLTELKQAEHRLQEQLDELRRWHDVTLGREMRILELKREVNDLLVKAGCAPRYASPETTPVTKDPPHA